MMDKALSQTYLSAIGIEQWIPRGDVVDSPQMSNKLLMYPRFGDVPVLATPILLLHDHIEVQPVIENTEFKTVDEPESVEIKTAEELTTDIQNSDIHSDDIEDDPVVRFTVQVTSANGIAFIDLCMHKLGHQRAHQQLAEAMIKAITKTDNVCTDNFVWPVANNPRIDSRFSAAQSASRSFLSSLKTRHEIKHIVILSKANDYFSNNDLTKSVFDFSLSDILECKVSKPLVWQKLQVVNHA